MQHMSWIGDPLYTFDDIAHDWRQAMADHPWQQALLHATLLQGVVADGQLGQLIGGYDPASGARLRRHPRQRLITIERIDPAAGTRTLEQKTLAPVAGFDLGPYPLAVKRCIAGAGDHTVEQRVERVVGDGARVQLAQGAARADGVSPAVARLA